MIQVVQTKSVQTSFIHALFSTQGLKYPGMPSFSDEPGKLYVMDLLHPIPTPVELQIKGDLDLSSFNPHGISVYTDETGEVQSHYFFFLQHITCLPLCMKLLLNLIKLI